MREHEWDKLLKISTTGRDDSKSNEYNYPYEPTPYSVLVRLAESGYIKRKSRVIDYGCGKGRVGFFLNYQLGCRGVGVEYDERIWQQAEMNQKSYVKRYGISFVCEKAEDFQVEDADCFYFFNPFSVEVLRPVVGRILESFYENPRPMRLFFYYPHDDYVAYLMTMKELEFFDEIDCQDLFDGENSRERILIFEVTG